MHLRVEQKQELPLEEPQHYTHPTESYILRILFESSYT